MTTRKQPRRWAGLLTLTLMLYSWFFIAVNSRQAAAASSRALASRAKAAASPVRGFDAEGPGGGWPGGGSVGPPLPLSSAIGVPRQDDGCDRFVRNLDSLIYQSKTYDEALRAALSPEVCQEASLPRLLWIARSRVYLKAQAGRHAEVAHEADSLLRFFGHVLGAEGIALLSTYKGFALYHLGRYTQAVAPMRRAVDHFPRLDATRAELSSNLAWALLRTGQHTEAFCRFVETRRVLQTAGQSAHNAEVLREVYKGLSEVTDSAGVLDEAHCTGTRYNQNGNQDGGGLALIVLIIAVGVGILVVREAARR